MDGVWFRDGEHETFTWTESEARTVVGSRTVNFSRTESEAWTVPKSRTVNMRQRVRSFRSGISYAVVREGLDGFSTVPESTTSLSVCLLIYSRFLAPSSSPLRLRAVLK